MLDTIATPFEILVVPTLQTLDGGPEEFLKVALVGTTAGAATLPATADVSPAGGSPGYLRTIGIATGGVTLVSGTAYLVKEYALADPDPSSHEIAMAEASIVSEILRVAVPTTQDEADNLVEQVRRACEAAENESTDCTANLGIYVPGGRTYTNKQIATAEMPNTGEHIHDVLVTGPAADPTGADAVIGNWWFLKYSQGNSKAIAGGFGGAWYDSGVWSPNPCNGRPAGSVCDEYPFRLTDAAGNLRGPMASLRPVGNESSAQGTDLGQFYQQCLQSVDEAPFIVIPAPLTYIQAKLPSVGFRVETDLGFTTLERCLWPTS